MVETKQWELAATDRCDAKECGAQAYLKATGVTGELFFCGHHYEEIMTHPSGYDKMMKFAFSIIDERERLIENRSKGEN